MMARAFAARNGWPMRRPAPPAASERGAFLMLPLRPAISSDRLLIASNNKGHWRVAIACDDDFAVALYGES
jgi:hypothetical protein